MNVLSLFDGMSCGRIALERAGIKVNNYFAAEIDKYAIKVSKANWPDIEHLGDVTNNCFWDLPKIDLLIGGSPCQGFSFSGKQLNFDDPRSKLFFSFIDCLNAFKPKYFFLENVRMKKESERVITKLLGVDPIKINSALVSAQNRKRLYWTNIPGICQPNDKGIILRDILENGENFVYQRARGNNPGGLRSDKSPCMGASSWQHNVKVLSKAALVRIERKNYSKPKIMPEKTGTLNTVNNAPKLCFDSGSTLIPVGGGDYRMLVPVECERLQTVPDNYTNHVSKTQRYKMLGNCWTIDVIVHIFKGLK
ncbi:MAG: hypothetical protein DRH97_00040 [Chloroflexi bacterium]|nr:MAG: hypothetical protein DRH97_00040 [Chloroflexota bacterium]